MNATVRFISETWNVRGLGDDDKCCSVYSDLVAAKPDLLAIQETKLASLSPSKAATFLPPRIRSFRSVDAVGSSGGILSAWDHNLSPSVTSSPPATSSR
jgi:exonuclease III